MKNFETRRLATTLVLTVLGTFTCVRLRVAASACGDEIARTNKAKPKNNSSLRTISPNQTCRKNGLNAQILTDFQYIRFIQKKSHNIKYLRDFLKPVSYT